MKIKNSINQVSCYYKAEKYSITEKIPTHLTTSFEDFIKKHRISKEGQEELRNLLKLD